MLFQSESEREQCLAIGLALGAGTIGEVEAGERLLEIDPTSLSAYLLLGRARSTAGDLVEAESLLWQGLERRPCAYAFYLALSDVRRASNPDDILAARLRTLGIWKLSFIDEIPDAIADSFRGNSSKLDFKDPETYRMLAMAMEVKEGDIEDPAEVQDRLLPYRLLNHLQQQADDEVLPELLRDVLANSALCLPVWRGALWEWAKTSNEVSTNVLVLIVALLAEIDGVDVLDDLFEISTFADKTIFLHTHWAIWRIGQRLPSETLAKMRAAIPSATLALRWCLAEQINLLPEVDGMAPALLELLEGFSGFADQEDAPYLLMLVTHALDELGFFTEAEQVMEQYSAALPAQGRKTLLDLTEMEGGFMPQLVDFEIAGLDIEDVCIERTLMTHDPDEDAEDSGEEEPIAPVKAQVKLERKRPMLVRQRQEVQEMPYGCRRSSRATRSRAGTCLSSGGPILRNAA